MHVAVQPTPLPRYRAHHLGFENRVDGPLSIVVGSACWTKCGLEFPTQTTPRTPRVPESPSPRALRPCLECAGQSLGCPSPAGGKARRDGRKMHGSLSFTREASPLLTDTGLDAQRQEAPGRGHSRDQASPPSPSSPPRAESTSSHLSTFSFGTSRLAFTRAAANHHPHGPFLVQTLWPCPPGGAGTERPDTVDRPCMALQEASGRGAPAAPSTSKAECLD